MNTYISTDPSAKFSKYQEVIRMVWVVKVERDRETENGIETNELMVEHVSRTIQNRDKGRRNMKLETS